ncbi:MAG: hypothetical protein M3Y28_08775 [Armatimonadota bacterium]|nr:hypothetical protein [Armatimonadota bacterium]
MNTTRSPKALAVIVAVLALTAGGFVLGMAIRNAPRPTPITQVRPTRMPTAAEYFAADRQRQAEERHQSIK